MEHAEEEIQFIEALANPKLLPLCMHREARFVDQYFRGLKTK
jgi:hypothetical protein